LTKILEIIVLDAADAIAAQTGGATSLEVIQRLDVGGLTPDFATLQSIREVARVHLNVIIRPQTASFVYSPAERDLILADVEQAVSLGAEGIVFGALTPSGDVDFALFNEVAALCPGTKLTFHRAIDEALNPTAALPRLSDIAQRILTSGTAPSAWAGRETIQAWVQEYGSVFQFACAAGVNQANIRDLAQFTGAPELHVGSAVRTAGKVDPHKVEELANSLF
jgi:copper homeostasis protein